MLPMDCNKDEAIRAKEIAEKKMANNDFEGARKIALKAQNLYPELDNISQLLSICEVHCSAQQMILGSERDWYGILQVERLADQLTIRKQYRRLALILHPDKNRFPGAEAAFKLICEANAALSDTAKKSLYDSKIRVLGRTAPVNPPPQNVNKNPKFNKQNQSEVANGRSSLNERQTTWSSSTVGLDVFWTCCPFCTTRYQYHREVVNRRLICPTCSKAFLAHELDHQAFPLGKGGKPGTDMHLKPGSSQPAAFQEKVVPNQSNSNRNVQNDKGSLASQAGSQNAAGKKTVRSGPSLQTGSGSEAIPEANGIKESGSLKPNNTICHNVNSSRAGDEGGRSKDMATNIESRNLKNKSRKRGRKWVEESSEVYDTSSGSDLEGGTANKTSASPAADLKSGPSHVLSRRSSRRKQNVSYNEGDDDDFANAPKRSKASKKPEDDVKEPEVGLDGEYSKCGAQNSFRGDIDYSEVGSKETGTILPEENLQDKESKSDKNGKEKEEGLMSDNAAETAEIKSDTDIDIHSRDNSDKDRLECPDPDFNDFEKERDASRFKIDQYWACYDTFDGMPRFYARVKKVSAFPFEVNITWLEAVPINEAFEDWVDEELPVGCGTFKLGKPDKISERITFSHEVHNIREVRKGKKRCSIIIYPVKDEVWALFKDWDLSWSVDPENHKKLKYEIVEVLSDFDPDTGIRVGYLDKVEGFVSLFQRTSKSDDDSFVIRPSELYKFSHCVPCFKMFGTEREGVPIGSFELDPASLPLNPYDLHFPIKAKVESRNVEPGVYPCTPKSSLRKGKSVISESKISPKNVVDLDRIDEEVPIVRRSPRGLNIGRKSTN